MFFLTNFTVMKAESEKIFCSATIEDDFSLSTIILVMNSSAKNLYTTYSEKDFSEYNCVNVVDLTNNTRKKILEQELNKNNQHLDSDKSEVLIDKDKFNRILKLELSFDDSNFSDNSSIKSRILEYVDELSKRDDVYYAGVDYYSSFSSDSTTDPWFDSNNQSLFESIKITDAWTYNTGSSEVKVGVIDSGIYALHEDLIGNIDEELSISFSTRYNDPLVDELGHGTFVAGIIGAVGNNGLGVKGVCWDVSLVSLKVCAEEHDNSGIIKASTSYIAAAVDYATLHNIPILNCSINPLNNGHAIDDPLLSEAIENYPGLFVVAAGNQGLNIDYYPVYPAAYNLENMICVGAAQGHNQIRETSNFGKNVVDVFAPGYIEYTTDNNGGYHPFGGTSCAAPFVSGLAALLKSYKPIFTTQDIKQAIISNVDEETAFIDKCVSDGIINAGDVMDNCIYSHNHQVNYFYNNSTKHTKTCVCGLFEMEPHAILIGTNTCIFCGGIVDNGFIGISSTDSQYYTLNGSYIRKDGVIVLNIKDLKSFLEGSLVFYNSNNY